MSEMSPPIQFIEAFAGIGGFSIGLQRSGMECVGFIETDPYARQVLMHRWPEVPCFNDIRDVGKDTQELPQCDLLCGGFP